MSQRRINTVLAALSFYLEEELAGEAGEPGTKDLLGVQEVRDLQEKLESGDLQLQPTHAHVNLREHELNLERESEASNVFRAYNFGDDNPVNEFDGWLRDGRFWSRKVYLDKGAVSFGIQFASDKSSKIVETWTEPFKS